MILKVRDRTQSQTGIIQSNKKGKSHWILHLVELSHKLVSNSQKKRKCHKILLLVERSHKLVSNNQEKKEKITKSYFW